MQEKSISILGYINPDGFVNVLIRYWPAGSPDDPKQRPERETTVAIEF